MSTFVQVCIIDRGTDVVVHVDVDVAVGVGVGVDVNVFVDVVVDFLC